MGKITFNPENKDVLTYGEIGDPAMKITEQADADQYKAAYVAYVQKFLDAEPDPDGLTAEQVVETNLGYWAGYYDNETRERVERLFRCSHPVFGSIAKNGPPTADVAFEAGLKRGESLKENQ